MDSDTYREILARLPELRKGFLGKAPQGGEVADAVHTGAELKLQLDIAKSKASWYGDFWKDAWCWARNFNPVLALFYSHRLHPVSQVERVFASLGHAVFVMIVSYSVPRANLCVATGQGACTASKELAVESAGGLFCAAVAVCVFHLSSTYGCFGHLITIMVFPVVVFLSWAKWLLFNGEDDTLGGPLVHFAVIELLSVVGTSAVQALVFRHLWHKQQEQNARNQGHEDFFVTSSDYVALVRGGGCTDLRRLC